MACLKSLNSDQISCVRFVNKSPRRVNIFWINFQGKLVRYAKALEPNDTMDINTYVTHPWIARDADTLDVLNMNKAQVFMPEAWDGESPPTEVCVHLPVYSLQERSMQVVRTNYTKEEMKDLEVARHVKTGLLADRRVNYDEYRHIH